MNDLNESKETSGKAFKLEMGQFICHLYGLIEGQDREPLLELIEAIEGAESNDLDETSQKPWKATYNDQCDIERNLRLTLLRGHRAIYYHQIQPLLNSLKLVCQSIEPVTLCLDDIKIFDNNEKTKQFICMVSSAGSSNKIFQNLKIKLKNVVDKMAVRLTDEDETDNTVAHCSLLSRSNFLGNSDIQESLAKIKEFIDLKLEEIPICVVKIDKIYLRVGHENYCINLKQ